MTWDLDVSLAAPFPVGDVAVLVSLEGGVDVKTAFRAGRLRGSFPARPTRLKLDPGPAPARTQPGTRPDAAPAGPEKKIALDELFERGCALPRDGRLILSLLAFSPCHVRGEQGGEGRRFASVEHMACAARVGLEPLADGGKALVINGLKAPFNHATPLPVESKDLIFGEIISLAGDFYAHLDARAAAEFAWAWPEMTGVGGWVAGDYRDQTLADDEPEAVSSLLSTIRAEKGDLPEVVSANFPARRYLALASQNNCHFACPQPGAAGDENPALRLYRGYHRRAMQEAARARQAADGVKALLGALVTDAFGCHFLTDLFASGHIRVPRRLLAEKYGAIRGSLRMSKSMHEEDNRLGLWCAPRVAQPGAARFVWRAYGDDSLRKPEAETHLVQVQEAVRRSAAEVFASYAGDVVAEQDRAEALIPVPLKYGAAPGLEDRLPGGGVLESAPRPNHYPMYWFASDGTVLQRGADPYENRYKPVDEPRGRTVTID
jgi:hypothetical protein